MNKKVLINIVICRLDKNIKLGKKYNLNKQDLLSLKHRPESFYCLDFHGNINLLKIFDLFCILNLADWSSILRKPLPSMMEIGLDCFSRKLLIAEEIVCSQRYL